MKTAKVILLAVVGLLLLADVSWRIWTWNANAETRALAKKFKTEVLHTNDWSGIGIYEAKSEQPLWIEFSQDEKPIQENYFFHGKVAFDITLSSNRPPKYSVWFRKTDKSVTWWLDRRGTGSFTERIFYDTNEFFSKHEIWYNEAWQVVDKRNGKNGIVLNGQWFQLAFDTNDLWTIEAKTNQ